MRLFDRLFGGRGARSFSFWLTLWGLVCGAVWLLFPFDLDTKSAVFSFVFYLLVFFDPLFWLIDFWFPGETELWMMPLLYVLFLYLLGRFLDWLFLEKTIK